MVLVTGAAGHIGNVLVRELVKQGESVRALCLPGEDIKHLQGLPVHIVYGDICECSSLEEAFDSVETVYHLASVITIMPGKNEMVKQVNIDGVKNIIRLCREHNVKRLIYTSSIHAFARIREGVIDETVHFDPLNPVGIYDATKATASIEVLKAAEQGLDAILVCPTGVIGPHDYKVSEMGHLINEFATRGARYYINGAYDFVDVRDVARGICMAAKKGEKGQVYILSGEKITIKELALWINKLINFRTLMIKIPVWIARFASLFTPIYYRLSHKKPRITPYSIKTILSNCNISHSKATRELDYHPRPIRESIHDTIEWFKKNHMVPEKVR